MEKTIVQNLVEIIGNLISKNTVSPQGNEYLLEKYLTKLMREINLEVVVKSKDKKRTNVIGTFGKGEKSLFIPLHMDVVPAGEGWNSDPFKLKVEGNKIYGRGVIDDKGPFAVAYLAIKKFITQYSVFDGKIILAAVADEELDNEFGIKYLIKDGLKATAALVPDGGWIDQLDIGEKGCVQLKVFAKGVQEHSALQENGNNAIDNLLDFMNSIRKVKWNKKFDKAFTPVKVNFSIINGGDFPNTIPARAFVQMDIRFPFGLKSKYILEEINKVKKSLKEKYELEIVYKTEPHKVNDKALITSFLEAAKNLKMKMKTITLPGNSVGKELTEAGIPSIVHYPASKLPIHEPNEFADLREYEKCVELYYEFLKLYFNV